MSDQSRAFPDRPDLRFLKLEAKRRLADGEFATLHDAQLAIAREHGLPSWTALKRHVAPPDHAAAHVRWVISRFAQAGGPRWTAPDAAELGAHFDERFLRAVPPSTLVRTLTGAAAKLREELVVTTTTPVAVRAQIADMRVEAVAEADPPHRLTGLHIYPVGGRVADPRVAAPGTRTSGDAPAAAVELVDESLGELGLVGLATAGVRADGVWTAAGGWADLDRAEILGAGHRFPAYSITKLITSTAVLRLVADGLVGLDDPANEHLRAVRLVDDSVTVRELLTHTGGVDSPDEMFADEVADLAATVGTAIACGGVRGTFAYSNGGYAALGGLIADVTGERYEDAAERLVLRPLGMSGSSFPRAWPGGSAITGYRLGEDGVFAPAPAQVCTVPAAGGLWSTAADLVRFAVGWASLLPAELAREALRPHADRDATGARIGLGWLLHGPEGLYGHAGGGPAAATSLIVEASTSRPSVALTSRLIPIEPVNVSLLRRTT